MNPGVFLNAQLLYDSGKSTNDLLSEFLCKNCLTASRDRRKMDRSRQEKLEEIVKDCALMRPN